MTTEAKPLVERKKLTVLDMKELKSIGDKGTLKLEFKAKGEDGKELWYFTFSKRFFEHIKKDVTLDAEVDTSTRESGGNTYTDRKVTNIFVDGQPIGGQKGSFGGGYNRPDNTASIESQTAAKIGAELLVAKIITPTDPLGKATISWALSRLSGGPATKPENQSPPVKQEPAPAKAPEALAVPKPKLDPASLKTITDLFRACNTDYAMQPADVVKELGYKDKSEITMTPAECYKTIQAIKEQPITEAEKASKK